MPRLKKGWPPARTPVPSCLYSCAADHCAEERSWPAEDLYWVPEWEGWYCSLCIEDSDEEVTQGISLAEFLKKVKRPVHA